MIAAARLEQWATRNRRWAPRRLLGLRARMRGTDQSVVIHDISATGLLIETSAALACSDKVEIELPNKGATLVTVVWTSGRYFGCQFDQPVSSATVSAALLQSPIENVAPRCLIEAVEAPADDEAELIDERYPLTVRLRVILAMTVALWALILWGATALA